MEIPETFYNTDDATTTTTTTSDSSTSSNTSSDSGNTTPDCCNTLDNRLTDVEYKLNDVDYDIVDIKGKINDLEDRVDDLKKNSSTSTPTTESSTDETTPDNTTTTNESVTSCDECIDDLKSLEDKVKLIDSKSNKIKDNLNIIEDKVNEIEPTINQLDERLSKDELLLDKLEVDVLDNKDSIKENSDKINKLEDKLNEINNSNNNSSSSNSSGNSNTDTDGSDESEVTTTTRDNQNRTSTNTVQPDLSNYATKDELNNYIPKSDKTNIITPEASSDKVVTEKAIYDAIVKGLIAKAIDNAIKKIDGNNNVNNVSTNNSNDNVDTSNNSSNNSSSSNTTDDKKSSDNNNNSSSDNTSTNTDNSNNINNSNRESDDEPVLITETRSGIYMGSSDKYTELPIENSNGDKVKKGDWAILTQNNGNIKSGIYVYNGFVYKKDIDFNRLKPGALIGYVENFYDLPSECKANEGDWILVTKGKESGIYVFENNEFKLVKSFSELMQSQLNNPSLYGLSILYKEPVNSVKELAEIPNPQVGEVRQCREFEPDLVWYVFSDRVTTGIKPKDGTKGSWIRPATTQTEPIIEVYEDRTPLNTGYTYNVYAVHKPITVMLPNVIDSKNKTVTVRKADDTKNKVLVVPTGKVKINDYRNSVLSYKNSTSTFKSDGSNWFIVSDFKIYDELDNVTIFAVDSTGNHLTIDGESEVEISKGKVGVTLFIDLPVKDNKYQVIESIKCSDTNTAVKVVDKYTGQVRLNTLTEASIISLKVTLKSVDIDYVNVGRIVCQTPQPSYGIYRVDGSLIIDEILANYLKKNPIKDFIVKGDAVLLPDWCDKETTTGMPLCIVGKSYIKVDDRATIATPVDVIVKGDVTTFNNGLKKQTIFKDVGTYTIMLDMPPNKKIKSITNSSGKAVIADKYTGKIEVQQFRRAEDIVIAVKLEDTEPTRNHFLKDTTPYKVYDSEKVIKEWDTIDKLSGTDIEVIYKVPVTQTDGVYLYIDYRLSNSTEWIKCFDSGLEKSNISGSFILKSDTVRKAIGIQFRYRMRSYKDVTFINSNPDMKLEEWNGAILSIGVVELGTPYVVSSAVELAKPFKVTVLDKCYTLNNGKDEVYLYEGIGAIPVTVDIPKDEVIVDVNHSSGMVVVDDNISGRVLVQQDLGGGDIELDVMTVPKEELSVEDRFDKIYKADIFNDGTGKLFLPFDGTNTVYGSTIKDTIDYRLAPSSEIELVGGLGKNKNKSAAYFNVNYLLKLKNSYEIDGNSFGISVWFNIYTIKSNNYLIGDSNSSPSLNKSLLFGFRTSTTFGVGFYGNGVNYSVKQEEFLNKNLRHTYFYYDKDTNLGYLYIDGVLINKQKFAKGDYVGKIGLFGGIANKKYFSGSMDMFRLFIYDKDKPNHAKVAKDIYELER